MSYESMSMEKTFNCALASSQPVIWLRTHETTEVKKELKTILKGLHENNKFRGVAFEQYHWNVLDGLTDSQGKPVTLTAKSNENDPFGGNPTPFIGPEGLIASIQYFRDMPTKKEEKNVRVLIVDNYHHFVNISSIQALQNFSPEGKTSRKSIVVLAHYETDLPKDLRTLFTVIDHELPTANELRNIANTLFDDVNIDNVDPTIREELVKTGLGLSRMQFESELTFALLKEKAEPVNAVRRLQDRKAALFNAEGLVRIFRTDVTFDDLGGLEGLKTSIRRAFNPNRKRFRSDRHPKGCILLGPGGTGKSMMAKAVGNGLGLPTVEVDFGSIKRSHVGESEGRVRRIWQILKAQGRCVVFIDEIEKAFPTGNELDAGVSSDILAVWLTNMADPTRECYIVASANNCAKLPSPLLRAGRFDNIWMVDIPNPEQQEKIWEICRKRYGIEDQEIPPHPQWTGAEIDACCDRADREGITLMESAETIRSIASRDPKGIEDMRRYADSVALDAETGKSYRFKPVRLSVEEPVEQEDSKKTRNVDPEMLT